MINTSNMKAQLIQRIRNARKIIIVGDAGRGKSTLAINLSEKLKLKRYSTDDFFWKVKFTVPHDRETSTNKINQIYSSKNWIVEGATRHLIIKGIEKADLIIYLGYKNILIQFWVLFKRNLKRDEEKLIQLIRHYKYIFKKKYKLGDQKEKLTSYDLITPYANKTIELHSFKEINQLINDIAPHAIHTFIYQY